jgi:hypothetical protein
VLLALACETGDFVSTNGDLRHREQGYLVAKPPAPPWQRVDLEGAALAYHRPDRAWMSMRSGCRRPVAQPRILAQHLLIGLGERTVHASEPVEVGSWGGWSQTLETLSDGISVRLKTVTLVVGRCAVDFILTAQRGFEEAEPAFDAWWRSYRSGPLEGAQ